MGPLTALAYILTLEDPQRFPKSRDVGPAIGLVPKQDQSGDHDPQLRITKTGNTFLRRLLVSSAQYILGPFGPDCGSPSVVGRMLKSVPLLRWQGSWPCCSTISGKTVRFMTPSTMRRGMKRCQPFWQLFEFVMENLSQKETRIDTVRG